MHCQSIYCCLLLLLLNWYQCRSGRFYCRPRSALTVFIGRSSHTRQPDNFVFEEELEPEPLNSAWRRCSWVLELDSPTPRQVLLRGIPRSSLADTREADSNSKQTQTGDFISTNKSFRLDGFHNCMNYTSVIIKLNRNTFLLRSMPVRSQLTLSMDLPHENPSVGIAVTALEPGYCAQDMVLHNGKCYAVIEQQNSSLTDVMQVISNSSSAGMQLARFSSLEEIRNFVKLNYEPEFDLPLKQPMNFKKPVRIGLFYSRSSNSVFEFIATRTGCEMKKHLNSKEFISAAKITEGPCAALQGENSESAAIIFVNCNQSMPSLISFPENPENSTCTDCDGKIRDWLENLEMEVLPVISNSVITIVTVASSASVLLVVTITATVCHRLLRNRSRDHQTKLRRRKDDLESSRYSWTCSSQPDDKNCNRSSALSSTFLLPNTLPSVRILQGPVLLEDEILSPIDF